MSHYQIQSDWNETDNSKVWFIKNKPNLVDGIQVASRWYPQGIVGSTITLGNQGPNIDLLNVSCGDFAAGERISGTTLLVNHFPHSATFSIQVELQENGGSLWNTVRTAAITISTGSGYNEEDMICSFIFSTPYKLTVGNIYRLYFTTGGTSGNEQVVGVQIIS